MVARRIIPCLDIKNGRVVKGVNFLNLKDAGDAVKNAKFYESEGADELVFLDITASYEKRSTTVELVEKVARVVFMPFTVGGGIRSISDIRRLLLAGAEKVSLNTAAVKRPLLVKEASRVFGRQCIVVAIDAKLKEPKKDGQRRTKRIPKKWEVYINGGRTTTGLDVLQWASRVEELGAGEILLTSMDCDGTEDGFDLDLTRQVSRTVDIPVIASGGAGAKRHFYDVFNKTGATAGLAASIFHYRKIKIKEIKNYLKRKGIEVRYA